MHNAEPLGALDARAPHALLDARRVRHRKAQVGRGAHTAQKPERGAYSVANLHRE